jgi:putative transposase
VIDLLIKAKREGRISSHQEELDRLRIDANFWINRDCNASRNILLAGMEQPVVPIESKPLHHISVMQVLAMKWEAVPFRAR